MTCPIFCCGSAEPWNVPTTGFIDRLRGQHNQTLDSFIAYSIKTRQDDFPGTAELMPAAISLNPPPITHATCSYQIRSAESPLSKSTPYVIHVEARNNFGPVISHRYFAPASTAFGDWTEMTHLQ
jgi:hypothetical protein